MAYPRLTCKHSRLSSLPWTVWRLVWPSTVKRQIGRERERQLDPRLSLLCLYIPFHIKLFENLSLHSGTYQIYLIQRIRRPGWRVSKGILFRDIMKSGREINVTCSYCNFHRTPLAKDNQAAACMQSKSDIVNSFFFFRKLCLIAEPLPMNPVTKLLTEKGTRRNK